MQSDTPETDKEHEVAKSCGFPLMVQADFARKMERERNQEMGYRGQWCDKAGKAEADRLTTENIRLKYTLAKWLEWARMHGHLDHAAGIADDSQRLLSTITHERLALPIWAEYGEGPPKRGDYNIKVHSKDGREKTITAWYNPSNGHWLADGKECGYVDIITPPGETEEWQITHWQNETIGAAEPKG